MSDFTKFAWQHEYNRSKWKIYTYEEHCILNKAVEKHQKRVTLPSTDPKKKINVNLEKMFQKNLYSGFEQPVRCLLFNKTFFCWSWKGDEDRWESYTPRLAFFLEVAHIKRLQKVNIFLKVDYEIDLVAFTQKNKETGYVRSICRESLQITDKDNDTFLKILNFCTESEKAIKRMCEESETSVRSTIFDLPSTSTAKSSSPIKISSPPEISRQADIRKALNAEILSKHFDSSPSASATFIPVDPDCPEANNYHIYCEGDAVYNVTLNLTSLQANSNKFFIIQLLKRHHKNVYAVWFHWGRVGYKGQNNLVKCGNNLTEAKATFEKKFYDKTLNNWNDRNNFQRNPSKYDLVHTDLNTEVSIPTTVAESILDNRIQNLLQIICDKKSLEEAAKDMCYDSKSTPLGKITAKQILEGYTALDRISQVIKNQGKGKDLVEACNVFYTKIPHDFGRKTPPILQSMEDVSEKLKMLEALSNIELAMGILNDSADGSENPIDKYYRSLECRLIPLENTSDEFMALKKCLLETHGPTHTNFTMELIDAFQCIKDEQELSFIDHSNKKLLWHGSRISNWIGILKKGLRIAPPEAPSTGYMFGKGIYFADVSSKSANYCFATKKKNEGLLLFSEVSLGKPLALHHAKDISKLSDGYNSTFGIGKFQPTSFESSILSSDASVPCGPLVENHSEEDLSLFYNEYIVYNVHQVKMKYLLRVRFNF